MQHSAGLGLELPPSSRAGLSPFLPVAPSLASLLLQAEEHARRSRESRSRPKLRTALSSSDDAHLRAMATDAATSRITAPQPALWHDCHHQQQEAEEDEDSKVDEDEDEYEVEAILGEKGGKFRVKWKGYAESEATWERAALCAGCPHLIESFRQAETLKKLRAAAGVAGRKRATRHGLRAQAALWHCGSGGEFPVHMEDVSSLVCEQIDEARDLCAVALVCKAWLRAAPRCGLPAAASAAARQKRPRAHRNPGQPAGEL